MKEDTWESESEIKKKKKYLSMFSKISKKLNFKDKILLERENVNPKKKKNKWIHKGIIIIIMNVKFVVMDKD